MSDTPETDKAEDRDPMMYDDWAWIVPANFARRLERERDEARRERDELRKNYLALAEEWKKSVFRLANERDEARRERDEAKSIISRLVSRRIISWGDVDSVLEAINEEEEEA